MSSVRSGLTSFRVLHVRQLTRQRLRATLAALALGAGVALTVASGLLISSISHSYATVLRSLSGSADLRVLGARDQAWLTPDELERVSAVPGVASAVPVVHTVALAERADGGKSYVIALGADCRAAVFVHLSGCDEAIVNAFRGDAPVAVSSNLKRELGSGSTILTDTGRVRLDGVLTMTSLDRLNQGRIAIFTLPTAQRVFSRRNNYDEIYIRTKHGADPVRVRAQIQAAVGSWNHVLGADEVARWQSGLGPLRPLLGLVAVIALGLSGLLVYNIASLSLAERRRDLAIAGALGYAPRGLAFGAIAEAATLGLGGGLIGAVAGAALAHPLVGAASSVSAQGIGLRLAVHFSPGIIFGGIVLGILTSIVAASIPVRRAVRVDLAAELHGRAASDEDTRRRSNLRVSILAIASIGAIGLSFLASRDGALEAWQSTVGALSLLATAVLVFALAGAATPLLIAVAMRCVSVPGAVRVALANLISRPRRTAALASAVAAAVGIACVLGALVFGIRGSVGATFGREQDGRVWVSMLPSVNNAGTTAGIPANVLAKLKALPGVASVDGDRCVREGDDRGPLQVCTMSGLRHRPVPLVAGEADRRVLDRGDVIVATGVARTRHVRPDGVLRVATSEGFRRLHIAGIWVDPNYNGYVATVSAQTFETLFGVGPPSIAMLRPVTGFSANQIAQEIRRGRIDPDLHAFTPDELTAKLSAELGEQVSPFWMVQRLLLFVALVATLSTLLLVGVQRRRELGILGAVGFGPRGLAAMTIAEAIAVGLGGSILGIVGSLGLYEVLRNVSVVAIGTTAPFRFDAATAALSSLLAVLVVAVGGLLPAWRVSRLAMVDAIREE